MGQKLHANVQLWTKKFLIKTKFVISYSFNMVNFSSLTKEIAFNMNLLVLAKNKKRAKKSSVFNLIFFLICKSENNSLLLKIWKTSQLLSFAAAVKLPSALSSNVRSDCANCAVRDRTDVCAKTLAITIFCRSIKVTVLIFERHLERLCELRRLR